MSSDGDGNDDSSRQPQGNKSAKIKQQDQASKARQVQAQEDMALAAKIRADLLEEQNQIAKFQMNTDMMDDLQKEYFNLKRKSIIAAMKKG